MKATYKTIPDYNKGQSRNDRAICELLMREITKALPGAESKIWHGAPVWFLNENPIVGYHKMKDCVRLLFWSGQSFKTEGLHPEGSFKAAEAGYNKIEEINLKLLGKWLAESIKIQWDYKNIVKRKGLLRLVKPGA